MLDFENTACYECNPRSKGECRECDRTDKGLCPDCTYFIKDSHKDGVLLGECSYTEHWDGRADTKHRNPYPLPVIQIDGEGIKIFTDVDTPQLIESCSLYGRRGV